MVSDRGNGGTRRLYQDPYLNPGGQDFVAAKIDMSETGGQLIVSFEDQIGPNRDNDFNDIIIQVDIVPKSDGTTHFNNIESASVNNALSNLGLLSAQYENIEELYTLPLSGSVFLEVTQDLSDRNYTLGVVPINSVATYNPTGVVFRTVAVKNMVALINDRVDDVGSIIEFVPSEHNLAGEDVFFVLIPNNTPENFLSHPHRYTPRGDLDDSKRQPLFSLNTANPDGYDQFLSFSNDSKTFLAIEDLARETSSGEPGEVSSSTFSSIHINITPKLTPKAYQNSTYRQMTTDVTIGWDGNDGWNGVQNGDF